MIPLLLQSNFNKVPDILEFNHVRQPNARLHIIKFSLLIKLSGATDEHCMNFIIRNTKYSNVLVT